MKQKKYKDYLITQPDWSHSVSIYNPSGELIKMLAGDILEDKSNNGFDKAVIWIDEYRRRMNYV